jgi:hypothetical protein
VLKGTNPQAGTVSAIWHIFCRLIWGAVCQVPYRCCYLSVAWSCYLALALLEDACTVAALAADGLVYFLPVMVKGAEEHPPFQAVEAVALLCALYSTAMNWR